MIPKLPSRTGRAALAAIGSMVDNLTAMITAFIITPMVLRYLGDDLYGVWIVAVQLVTYLTLLDVRPMSVLKLTLAQSQGDADLEKKRRQVATALRIAYMVMPIYLLGGAVYVWGLPKMIAVAPDAVTVVRAALVFLVVHYTIANIVGLPNVILEGMNLAYKSFGLNAGVAIIMALCDYLAIYFDLGLVVIAANKLLGLFIKSTVSYLIMRRSVAWFGLGRVERGELRYFLRLSGWMFLLSLVYILGAYSQMAMVGVFLGPGVVTLYSLTATLMNRVRGPVQQVLALLRSGTGDLFGRGQLQQLVGVRKELIHLTTGLLFAIGCVVVLLNHAFLALWVGPGYFGGSGINLLVVLLVLQTLLNGLDSNLLESMLAVRSRSLIGLVSVTLSLVMAGVMILTPLGLTGFVGGLLLGNLVRTVMFPVFLARQLKTSPLTLLWDLTAPLLVTVPVLIVLAWIVQPGLVAASWASLLMQAALVFIAGLAWVWLIQLRPGDRLRLKNRFWPWGDRVVKRVNPSKNGQIRNHVHASEKQNLP